MGDLPESWDGPWTDYAILRGRSLSPATLANYRDSFVQLAKFVGPLPLEDVTRRHVAAYLESVAESQSGTTAAMRYRGLHAVFGVLAKPDEYGEALLGRNPMAGMSAPKAGESLTPVLGLDEVKRLIAAWSPDRRLGQLCFLSPRFV